MKQKILNLLIIIGLAGVVALGALVVFKVISFGTLWLMYSFLGCLLLVFVCLNLKYRRYTDLDETVSCIRRAKRAVAKINTSKDIKYMKKLTIQNQLTNAALLLDDLIAKHDFYTLRDNLAYLCAMRDRFKSAVGTKMRLDKDIQNSDLSALDVLLDELKAL